MNKFVLIKFEFSELFC